MAGTPLLTDQLVDATSNTQYWDGKGALWAVWGTPDGATLSLQYSPITGIWIELASVTAAGAVAVSIPQAPIRVVISGGGGSLNVSSNLMKVEAAGSSSGGGGGGGGGDASEATLATRASETTAAAASVIQTAIRDRIGALDDASETDPDAASVSSLAALRGLLELFQPSTDPVPIEGWAFAVPVAPTVTAGAYAANDIMGGLLTFADVAQSIDSEFIVMGVQIICKSAVILTGLTLILFDSDPTSTTKTDNAPYALNAADALRPRASISMVNGIAQDHGTPNSIRVDGLCIPMSPVAGTRTILGLLIDSTGLTLGSISDIQVLLRGLGP